MAKKKYTLTQFYNSAIAIVEKYGFKILPENVFSVEIKIKSYKGEPLKTSFSVWYSNGKDKDFQCIASSEEETPLLALLFFEADFVKSFKIEANPKIDEITV